MNTQLSFKILLMRHERVTVESKRGEDDGCVHVMSRTDDIMPMAGHCLSTESMELTLAEHSAISECSVVPLSDKLKG